MLGSGKCSVKLPMQFQNATLCGIISVDDHMKKKFSRARDHWATHLVYADAVSSRSNHLLPRVVVTSWVVSRRASFLLLVEGAESLLNDRNMLVRHPLEMEGLLGDLLLR